MLPYLETFVVAAIVAGLAAQNAVIAAESLGLSTVYIAAMRNDPRPWKFADGEFATLTTAAMASVIMGVRAHVAGHGAPGRAAGQAGWRRWA